MGDIYLDFRPEVTESHLESLERTLPGIKGDDYVMVILDKEEAHEAKNVRKILLQNGFEVSSQGALGTEFALTAKRLLH
ncbi:hypothetical protein [Candidatus Formimonas warabiya]|uniref:Uncharacterized protein n=1 Tax=Formimonas warabiya TaxID=1761012 RepID=A0A3G1KML9_FORW1|nr:hypothetical protein [Candidatus Formimonas warabiya]ATW23674.1 hypothetical protein DCMF_01690 [Candidatus Formimonas warabiya]